MAIVLKYHPGKFLINTWNPALEHQDSILEVKNPDGSITVSLPENETYQFLNTEEAAAVNKSILKTVAPQKQAAASSNGKITAKKAGTAVIKAKVT